MARARRVCAVPGCPVLAVEGGTRCPSHLAAHVERLDAKHKARQQEYDAHRPNAQDRGYGARHRAWRSQILERDKVCQGWPHGSGCGQPTTVADHVVPKNEGGAHFDLRNGQGMCDPCHQRKRQEESMRARRRPNTRGARP